MQADQHTVVYLDQGNRRGEAAFIFDANRLDCLTTIVLKILDGKCQMDSDMQDMTLEIYKSVDKQHSFLFDLYIHRLIERVFDKYDRVDLKAVHELRLFAEKAIPKPAMKAFKRDFRRHFHPAQPIAMLM